MQKIKISHLTLGSLVELSATLGLVSGIIIGLVSTVMVLINSLSPNSNFFMLLLMNLIGIPLLYLFSGILLGVIGYLPYKWYMKLRKGTTLYYEMYELD